MGCLGTCLLLDAFPLLLERAYYCAGACSGLHAGARQIVHEAAGAARLTAAETLEAAAEAVESWLAQHSADLLTKAYVGAGASIGLYLGFRGALQTAWILMWEDEVQLRLVKGSPVRYRPADFDLLAQRGRAAERLHPMAS